MSAKNYNAALILREGLHVGNLVLLRFLGTLDGKNACWLCRCICGVEKAVGNSTLRHPSTRSCGCLRAPVKHGYARLGKVTREYKLWLGMKRREELCALRGPWYFVCERWRNSFENFLADMKERPGPEYSIERVDNAGPYSPENCKWATRAEQDWNRRSNRRLTIHGETRVFAYWLKLTTISRSTVKMRLHYGWPAELAVFAPVGYRYKNAA